MMIRFARIVLLTLSIAAAAAPASAQLIGDADAERGSWFGYRDFYQAMIRFEKFGKPKQFIQSRLRIVAQDKAMSWDGMRLTLAGKSVHLNLPVDAAGLAVFPLLKAAYDENAELRINRPNASVRLEQVTTIAVRADGIYELADLRTACDQVLQFTRYIGTPIFHEKQCVGVKFAYAKETADVSVKVRGADQHETKLPAIEGSILNDEVSNRLKIAIYRFADRTEAGQVVTNTAPLAIAAILE